MPCPHLEYRTADDDQTFDHERPYCAIQDAFVSPMQADICNDRFEFHHAEDCAVFREAAGAEAEAEAETEPGVETTAVAGTTAGADESSSTD